MSSSNVLSDAACPYKAKENDVYFRFAYLDRCSCYELQRREIDNVHVTNDFIQEASQFINKLKQNKINHLKL